MTGEVVLASYPWQQKVPTPYPDVDWHPGNWEYIIPGVSPPTQVDFTGKVAIYPHGFEVVYNQFGGCGIVAGIYGLQIQGAKAVIVEGKRDMTYPI